MRTRGLPLFEQTRADFVRVRYGDAPGDYLPLITAAAALRIMHDEFPEIFELILAEVKGTVTGNGSPVVPRPAEIPAAADPGPPGSD